MSGHSATPVASQKVIRETTGTGSHQHPVYHVPLHNGVSGAASPLPCSPVSVGHRFVVSEPIRAASQQLPVLSTSVQSVYPLAGGEKFTGNTSPRARPSNSSPRSASKSRNNSPRPGSISPRPVGGPSLPVQNRYSCTGSFTPRSITAQYTSVPNGFSYAANVTPRTIGSQYSPVPNGSSRPGYSRSGSPSARSPSLRPLSPSGGMPSGFRQTSPNVSSRFEYVGTSPQQVTSPVQMATRSSPFSARSSPHVDVKETDKQKSINQIVSPPLVTGARSSPLVETRENGKQRHDPENSSGSGLVSGYAVRPDIWKLLQRLQVERPAKLGPWLRSYTFQLEEEEDEPSSSSHAAAPRVEVDLGVDDLLDWRFYIMNKEKEIYERARYVTHRVVEVGHSSQRVAQAEAAETFNAYIPDVVKDAINKCHISVDDAKNSLGSSPLTAAYDPVISSFDAAVVFADASGFTALTEKLTESPNGADEIGACLNRFFSPLINIARKFGGDILKFSGDAVTILWPVSSPSYSGGTSAALAAASACNCCLEFHEKVESFGKTPVEGVTLTLHVGVGFGHLNLLQFGGLLNRWEYCASGVGLFEATLAEPMAKPGETMVSPSVQEILLQGAENGEITDNFTFAPSTTDDDHEGYALLIGNSKTPTSRNDRLAKLRLPIPQTKKLTRQTSLSMDDYSCFERFIPSSVLTRMSADGSEPEAEMRRVAVIFFTMRGLDCGGSNFDAKRTQLLFRLFQRSCYALEGSVNKFLIDDKGMVLLAVFGLPPLNHYTDDPTRAVLTARRLCDTLHEEELQGRAGVATGYCWCGQIGNEQRREFTVLGDTVNLSARLSSNAKWNSVLVDENTFKACRKLLLFDDSRGAIKLKGKLQPVKIFQFTGNLLPSPEKRSRGGKTELLSWKSWQGTSDIVHALEHQLIHSEGPGGIVFVQGGAGCGKSEAVEVVKAWAASKGFALFAGQNLNSTASFTVPRLCWQEVFGALMAAASKEPHWSRNSDPQGDGEIRREYKLLIRMLKDAGAGEELLAWAPMLSFVVPGIKFGVKGASALLERDEQRTCGTPRLAELCATLLDAFVSFSTNSVGTVVLVHIRRGTSFFQDSNIHDENIARAIGELCVRRRPVARRKPLIFCFVSRESTMANAVLSKQSQDLGGFVVLNDLDRQGTAKYLEHLLGNDVGVSDNIVDHVYRVCGGNPYSVEVLLKQLLKLNMLSNSSGFVSLASGSGDAESLSHIPFPEELKGLALQSFEQHEYQNQIILKNAAICSLESEDGSFTISELQETLADNTSNERLLRRCLQLVNLGFFIEPVGQHAVADDTSDSRWFASPRQSITGTADADADAADGDNYSDTSPRFFFVSTLLRHVASTMVLKVNRVNIQNRIRSMSLAKTPKTQQADVRSLMAGAHMFDVIDHDNDGVITRDEWDDAMVRIASGEPDLLKVTRGKTT